tara:strand:+ start:795 stop:1073 length:279 start_codon:yes stop_codon:yes gene_type:complete
MVVGKFPFEEEIVGPRLSVRTFDPHYDSEEFVWHRDRQDRIITVIDPGGWKFQFENDLPMDLEENFTFKITKGTYHRVIPGDDYLEILVEKL